MSIIIRLQNLPWSANSVDIRRYFQGLSIPEGGVHIVGGEKGDAFIAFSTDEDARQAMEKDGGKIKEIRIKLFLSSRTEMQRVIEQARSQNLALQATVPPPAQPAISVQKTVTKETDRRRPADRSRSPERRRDRDKSPVDRDRSSRRSSRRERSRSRSPRRLRDRERERHADRSKRDERRRSEELSKSARDEDVRSLPTAEQLGISRDRDIDKRQLLPNGDVGTPLPDMRAISAYLPSDGPSLPPGATFTTTSYPSNYSMSSTYPSGGHLDRNRLERVPPVAKDFDSLKQPDTHWNTSFPHSENKKETWDENRRALLAPPANAYDHDKPFLGDKRNYSSEPTISRGRYGASSDIAIAETKFPPYSAPSHVEERGRPDNLDPLLPRPTVPSHREDYDGYREPRSRLDDSNSSRYDDSRMSSDDRSMPSLNRDHSHHSSQLLDTPFESLPRPLGSCVEIRGMPYNVNYKDVREFFRGLYLPSDGLKLINDETGHRTGVGYVRFANEHDASEAVKRTGQYMGNSFIEILKCSDDIFQNAIDSYVPASTRKTPSNALINRLPPKEEDLCILLKGLPYQCKEDAIINFFDGLGILDVFIEYDRNGRAIGTGFVEFCSYDDFQAAMNMNRNTIGHRYIELSVASKEMMSEARKSTGHSRPGPTGDSSSKELLSSTSDSPSPSCVLMQGLPYDVTDRDIADFFAEVGVVPRAIHIMLGPNGMPYGDAFAEFSTPQEFDRAIKKTGQLMGPVMVTVKSIPYNDMIEILGGPREGPLLDRPPTENRERSEIPERMDIVQRRIGIQERRMAPPERRIDHVMPERRIDHGPPSERRIGPNHNERRMGRLPPPNQSQDRRGSVPDRRMDHPPDRRSGMSDRRMGHQDRRGPNRRPDPDPNEKVESMDMKNSNSNMANDVKPDDSNRNSDKGDHLAKESNGPMEKRRHLIDAPSWAPNDRDRIRLPSRPLLDPDERAFIPPPGPEVRPMLRGLIPGPRPRMHMDGPDHRGPIPRGMGPPPRGPPMPRGPPHMGERMRPPFGIVHGPEGFGKPGCVVAITNMAYQAGVEDILGFFKEYSLGKEDVIRRFNERGQPTGEARISFHTPGDAQKAVQELNRQPLAGRPVNLYLV